MRRHLLFLIASALLMLAPAKAQIGRPEVSVLPAGPGAFLINGANLGSGVIIRLFLPVNGSLRQFDFTTSARDGTLVDWTAHYPCGSAQDQLRVVVEWANQNIYDQKTTGKVCLPK